MHLEWNFFSSSEVFLFKAMHGIETSAYRVYTFTQLQTHVSTQAGALGKFLFVGNIFGLIFQFFHNFYAIVLKRLHKKATILNL